MHRVIFLNFCECFSPRICCCFGSGGEAAAEGEKDGEVPLLVDGAPQEDAAANVSKQLQQQKLNGDGVEEGL